MPHGRTGAPLHSFLFSFFFLHLIRLTVLSIARPEEFLLFGGVLLSIPKVSRVREKGTLRRLTGNDPGRADSYSNIATYGTRPLHQRHFSASASLVQRRYDDDLLKPPPRFARPPAPTQLPSPLLASPMIMASPATASPAYYDIRHQHGHAPVYNPPTIPRTDAREPQQQQQQQQQQKQEPQIPQQPLLQQSTEDFILRTDRSNARAMQLIQQQPQQQKLLQQQPPQAPAAGGAPPTSHFALQAPTMDASAATEGLPVPVPRRPGVMYNIPRRLSSSSSVSTVSPAASASRESFESRMRSSSWSSQTSLE